MKAMKIFYDLNGALYANITNKCPCNCTFCIRHNEETVGENDSLWLEHDPDFNEIKAAFTAWNLADFTELVFCGYGEPTEALEMLMGVDIPAGKHMVELKYIPAGTVIGAIVSVAGIVMFIIFFCIRSRRDKDVS